MAILKMSVSATILILAIVIIRALALHKLPKKTFLVLWGVAWCHLLIPLSIPSRFSVYTVVDMLKNKFSAADTSFVDTAAPNIGMTAGTISTTLSEATSVSISPFRVVWLIGLSVCALFFLVTHLRCRREYKTALPVENEFVKDWRMEHPLRRKVEIRQSDKIAAPLTYGIFRPVVLLPKKTDWTDETRLRYILTHEHVHIWRFDTLTKLLLATALCVHWFNPLVWVMYVLANRDIELSCDETVVRTFGETMKSAYALTLIGLEEKKSRITPLVNNFSKNAIEERIVSIMKMKKTTMLSLGLAFFLVVGATTVFATSANGAYDETEAAHTTNNVNADIYSQYEAFGLTLDKETGKLYYDRKLVRCFDDQIPAAYFSAKGIGYYEENGVIDVRVVRKNDGSTSVLVGLEVLSSDEFENRVIDDPTESDSTDDNDLFSEYEKYGLSYDDGKKALFYNGKQVRLFLDIRNSNGKNVNREEFLGNTISNWDKNGTIDVYAVRSYDKLDENGYGKLTGLRVASSEEFKENSSNFGKTNSTTETAD